ncbi:MAG: hypothetical protein AB7K04_10695 [Pseudorhodoplanes sp.]
MNNLGKHSLAYALSLAVIGVSVAPSFAQTRSYHPRQMQMTQQATAEMLAQRRFGQQWVPGYVLASPYQCWTDEGNGHFSDCDGGR